MALSMGDCPVCSVTGQLILLAALHDGRVFVACDMCAAVEYVGVSPVQQSTGIASVAPAGFRPAGEREAIQAGFDVARLHRVDDSVVDRFF